MSAQGCFRLCGDKLSVNCAYSSPIDPYFGPSRTQYEPGSHAFFSSAFGLSPNAYNSLQYILDAPSANTAGILSRSSCCLHTIPKYYSLHALYTMHSRPAHSVTTGWLANRCIMLILDEWLQTSTKHQTVAFGTRLSSPQSTTSPAINRLGKAPSH